MKIDIQLSEEDYLTYQLYNASNSVRIKKRRLRSRIIPSILYLLLGGLSFLFTNNFELSIIVVGFGILWFFAYPIRDKHRYIRHYRGSIQDNYKERYGKTVSIEYTNEFIFASDNSCESKIQTNQIESFIEIPTLILIKYKEGGANIIPKNKIADQQAFVSMLKEMATNLNIEYKLENNWKWK